ncbi:hypothetical protein PROFUN_11045 [Planoprotostelium fungivorum]|uniref:Transcription factor CBF/NF-Y/archaeal histone domain-containing protein n=1 Tax=Planoprotostelium fungivorum TaxID=1890364 RepID=A0A2P6NBP4_9EUKA|nr:hypothetical protein PROFUN_11045 [Planoprotostelium fungivorum]
MRQHLQRHKHNYMADHPSLSGDELDQNSILRSSVDPLEIPKACILRIAKNAEVDGGTVHIANDAKDSLIKAARLFINYLTAGANESCLTEGKVTLNAQHVLKALDDLELPYKEQIEQWLTGYQSAKDKKKKDKALQSSDATNTIKMNPSKEVLKSPQKPKESEPKSSNKRPLSPNVKTSTPTPIPNAKTSSAPVKKVTHSIKSSTPSSSTPVKSSSSIKPPSSTQQPTSPTESAAKKRRTD